MKIIVKKTMMNHLLEYVIVFLVLTTPSVWVQGGTGIISSTLFNGILMAVSCIYVIINLRRIDKRYINTLALLAVCAGIYTALNADYLASAYLFIFIPCFVFLFVSITLAENETWIKFVKKIVDIMIVLALVSLFFYLFASTLHMISPTGYYSYDWSWISRVPSYYNIYFEPMPAGLQGNFIARNCGIYTEAPMFAFPLSIALCIQELFLKRNIKKTVILVITIATTVSTTGYLIVLLLYMYKFIFRQDGKRPVFQIVLACTALVAGVFAIVYFLENKSSTGSYNVRSDHLFSCLRIFAASLGSGIGFGNREIYSYFEYEQGLSVGFPYVMAAGGIGCTLLFLVPILSYSCRAVKSRSYHSLAFAVLFFALFFMTNDVLRIRPWFILAIFFMRREERETVGGAETNAAKKEHFNQELLI